MTRPLPSLQADAHAYLSVATPVDCAAAWPQYMSVRGAPGEPSLVAHLEFLAPDRDHGVVWDDAKILGVMPPGWGVFGDETALRALASAYGRLVIVVCLGLMPFQVLYDLARFLYLAYFCNHGAFGLCVVLLGSFFVHI